MLKKTNFSEGPEWTVVSQAGDEFFLFDITAKFGTWQI